uniref:Uncharacterized protein n=1 Tax=Micrurus lemniscatus lemniscatus TaxID=129467 RepID=A0A2D4HTG3_MICLE
MKAYLRGITIACTANRNKEKWKKQNLLIKKLKELEDRSMKAPGDKQTKNDFILLKHELNILEQEDLIKTMLYTKQNYFEHANKPGRWLAYKLKKENKKEP